jgi:hypothetical protein
VLLVGKVMLSIANLMVDGGCIATTGGRRLFCICKMEKDYVTIVQKKEKLEKFRGNN